LNFPSPTLMYLLGLYWTSKRSISAENSFEKPDVTTISDRKLHSSDSFVVTNR